MTYAKHAPCTDPRCHPFSPSICTLEVHHPSLPQMAPLRCTFV